MIRLFLLLQTPDPSPLIAGPPPPTTLDPTTTIIVLAATVVLIAVLYPIARAIARRMERTPVKAAVAAASADSEARIHRLEQAIEAMEVELERISEGQRYTTKLLTERLPLAASVAQPGQSEKTLR